MSSLPHPCNSLSLFKKSSFVLYSPSNYVSRIPNFNSFCTFGSLKSSITTRNVAFWRSSHKAFSSQKDSYDAFSSTQLPESPQDDSQELELLNKPPLVSITNGSASEVQDETKKEDKDKVLEPFLKFFKAKDSSEEETEEDGESRERKSEAKEKKEEREKVTVEYYDPKPGDFVVGVVVSGNENRLDVNIGADMLGAMLTKEVLPLYGREIEYLLCDFRADAEEFMVRGKMGVVRNDQAMGAEPAAQGRPVVEVGTVLFAEVLGRTLSGRPLLSTRRLFRRIAWHRVRQIKQVNEPIKVKITEWNTGGLLTRIEGLRAFLPKAELLNRVNTFTELKENVGHQIDVLITRIDEETNDLILSEKEAWEMLYLREGTLLEGTVKKIFPYGAQIRIAETNRSGLLHISNITRARVTSVSDLLAVGEKVKVLVMKSMFPGKISLSIADLEREPGLFLSNKEKVFAEAEEMSKKYRQTLPVGLAARIFDPPPSSDLPFNNEAKMYANWEWFKFDRDYRQTQQ